MCIDVDTFRVHQLLACEAEELARDVRGAPSGTRDFRDVLSHGIVWRETTEGGLAEAEDHRQQVVEVVRDAAREAAEDLHALGLPQAVVEAPPLGFREHQIGDVTHHSLVAGDDPCPIAMDDNGVRHVAVLAIAVLESVVSDTAGGRVEELRGGLDQCRYVIRMHVLEPQFGTFRELLRRDAGQGLALRADIFHAPSVRVSFEGDPVERFGCTLDDETVFLFRVPQLIEQRSRQVMSRMQSRMWGTPSLTTVESEMSTGTSVPSRRAACSVRAVPMRRGRGCAL